jgi:hypothetical protein
MITWPSLSWVELDYGVSSKFLDRWINDIFGYLVLGTALIPFHLMLFWCLVSWGTDSFTSLPFFQALRCIKIQASGRHEGGQCCVGLDATFQFSIRHTSRYFVVTFSGWFLGAALIVRAHSLPFDISGICTWDQTNHWTSGMLGATVHK